MHEIKTVALNRIVSIEYEYNWEHNVPDVKASAEYFNKEKRKMLKK